MFDLNRYPTPYGFWRGSPDTSGGRVRRIQPVQAGGPHPIWLRCLVSSRTRYRRQRTVRAPRRHWTASHGLQHAGRSECPNPRTRSSPRPVPWRPACRDSCSRRTHARISAACLSSLRTCALVAGGRLRDDTPDLQSRHRRSCCRGGLISDPHLRTHPRGVVHGFVPFHAQIFAKIIPKVKSHLSI